MALTSTCSPSRTHSSSPRSSQSALSHHEETEERLSDFVISTASSRRASKRGTPIRFQDQAPPAAPRAFPKSPFKIPPSMNIRSNSHDSERDSDKMERNAETFLTPQNYTNVKPLQAAFMSTGILSKRGRANNSDSTLIKEPDSLDLSLDASIQGDSVDVSGDFSRVLPHPMVAALSGNASKLPPPRKSLPPGTPCKKGFMASNNEVPFSPPNLHVDPPSDRSSGEYNDSQLSSPLFASQLSPEDSPSYHARAKVFNPAPSPDDSGFADLSTTNTCEGSKSPIKSPCPPTQSKVRDKRPPMLRRRSSGSLPLTLEKVRRKRASTDYDFDDGEAEPLSPTRTAEESSFEASQLVASPAQTPMTPFFPKILMSTPKTGGQAPPVKHTPSFYTPHHNTYSTPQDSTQLPTPFVTPANPSPSPRFLSRTGRQSRTRPSFPFPRVSEGRISSRKSHGVHLSLKHRDSSSPKKFGERFTLENMLGSGEFSDVFAVTERETGTASAVKRTKLPYGGPKDRLRRLEEVDALRQASTPKCQYVVTLHDAWEEYGHLYIRTELCNHGSLDSFLEEWGAVNGPLEETRAWKILGELVQGLAHIHAQGVIHLDLKPANIFITESGSLKIGDFGLATRWPRSSAVSVLQGAGLVTPGGSAPSEGLWFAEGQDTRRGRCKSWGGISTGIEREGDREYIAREVLDGRYGPEADIFSLGLIILEIVANIILPDNGPPWHKLRSNDLSDIDLHGVSPDLVGLINAMMEKNADRRMTVSTILEEPIIKVLVKLQKKRNGQPDPIDKSDSPQSLEVHGAVIEEPETFLENVMHLTMTGWVENQPRISATDVVSPCEGQQRKMELDC